jgi:copper chaperone CopZ
MTTAVIEVRGMRCGGCERSVREAVRALPGVRECTPEHIADEVEVTFDPKLVDLADIRAAIKRAGFAA